MDLRLKKYKSKDLLDESPISLLSFYIKIIKLSGKKLMTEIDNYINSILMYEHTNKIIYMNELKNLIYFLIILSRIDGHERRFYYPLLKGLIIEKSEIILMILNKFPPNYGELYIIGDLRKESLIDGYIVDRFKFLLKIIEKIDENIDKDIVFKINKKKNEIHTLMENNKLNNNKFIEKIKNKYILEEEINYIDCIMYTYDETK
jgi:hypothetical protein